MEKLASYLNDAYAHGSRCALEDLAKQGEIPFEMSDLLAGLAANNPIPGSKGMSAALAGGLMSEENPWSVGLGTGVGALGGGALGGALGKAIGGGGMAGLTAGRSGTAGNVIGRTLGAIGGKRSVEDYLG